MKKLSLMLFLSGCFLVSAETKEQVKKRFAVQPGGSLVVDVGFGSIAVSTNSTSEVTVDVVRKVAMRRKADEEQFLRDHPIIFSQDGSTVTVRSKGNNRGLGLRGIFQRTRTEAKYTITVPAKFDADLKTAGGGIAVSDVSGHVDARTSGGGLEFTRLRGPLNGGTSGGGIRVRDCGGELKVATSGGGIDVTGGSGSLEGSTSGGSVTVREFQGPVRVSTSGGGIRVDGATGPVYGSTSGGSVTAQFASPVSGDIKLETSGGGVTLSVPENSAFNLDAATSGGGVRSDLPVSIIGKVQRDHLKGTVNGGGKSVLLRSSGGGIHIRKQ